MVAETLATALSESVLRVASLESAAALVAPCCLTSSAALVEAEALVVPCFLASSAALIEAAFLRALMCSSSSATQVVTCLHLAEVFKSPLHSFVSEATSVA